MEINEKEGELIGGIKERLEIVAAKHGINMEQLCEKGGISKPTLYRYINDGITTKNHKSFVAFCNQLGANPEWVKTGVGNEDVDVTQKKGNNEELMVALDRIEAHWKSENEFLKARLQAQEEMNKSLQETIAVLVKAKFEVTDIEPRKETPVIVMAPKNTGAVVLPFPSQEERQKVANGE